jgi:hypothetical protein
MTDRAFVRKLAEDALSAAGISRPPVDLDDLARVRALRIERNADLAGRARASFRAEDGLIRVVALPPRVERFPIAHELGHAILGDGGSSCTEQMIMAFDDAVSLADAVASFNPEATASAIAGHILIPPSWLLREVKAGLPIAELQERFDVTRPVLMIAIDRDRLLNRVATERS